MGRPCTVTEKVKDALVEFMIDGGSLRQFCEKAENPSRSAFLRALDADEVFAARYARAREAQGDYMDELIQNEAEGCTPENAVAVRVKIDAYKWRAAKLKPKVYGDKIDVTSGNEPIQLDEVARATRLAAIFSEIEKRNADS